MKRFCKCLSIVGIAVLAILLLGCNQVAVVPTATIVLLPTNTPLPPTPTPIPIPRGNLSDPYQLEHETRLWSVAFSPDGNIIATGDHNFYISFWDRQNRTLLKTWKLVDDSSIVGGIESIAFSPDGTQIAACIDKTMIQIWDIESEQIFMEIPYKCREVVTYSKDGKFVFAGSRADVIKAWNSETGEEVLSIPIPIKDLKFNMDDSLFIYGDMSNNIYIWDWPGKQEVTNFRGNVIFHQMTFSPDGASVVVLDTQNTISVLDAETGKFLLEISPETDTGIVDILFSPGGHFLFVVHSDGSIGIWDFKSQEKISNYASSMPLEVSEVALASDGSALAIAGITREGLVMLWEFSE